MWSSLKVIELANLASPTLGVVVASAMRPVAADTACSVHHLDQ
jgi:hypothetical protein